MQEQNAWCDKKPDSKKESVLLFVQQFTNQVLTKAMSVPPEDSDRKNLITLN